MSLLDLIRIAEPCTESWSSMTGDERARHCGKCDKTVFDLSVLTRAEAEALLAARGLGPEPQENANMCGRYFERADGTIVLADCLVRRKRRRIATAGVLTAAAALVGSAILHEGSPEAVMLDNVVLPDDTEATLPRKEIVTEQEHEELLERLRAIEEMRRGDMKAHGQMLGGAISFESDDVGRVLGNVEKSQ